MGLDSDCIGMRLFLHEHIPVASDQMAKWAAANH